MERTPRRRDVTFCVLKLTYYSRDLRSVFHTVARLCKIVYILAMMAAHILFALITEKWIILNITSVTMIMEGSFTALF
jgi:hypothetical protein